MDDEKPYQEISSDQLSSVLTRLPVVIIGPVKGRRASLYSAEHLRLWADAYDEDGEVLDDITFMWECSDVMAIEFLPISYGFELGFKSSREVWLYAKGETGIYTITALAIYNKKEIKATIEVEIMEKIKPPDPSVAKVTGSQPQTTPPKEVPLVSTMPVINAEFTTPAINSTGNDHTLVPVHTQMDAKDDIDVERKLTKTDITISETSLEERKRQQQSIIARQQKTFLASAADMTNPIANVDTYVATMSYICFATGVAYVENGNYMAGALFLLCFAIFAIAKQGLPEGVFTQWLKNRSQTTVHSIHKTIIGDKK